MGKKIKEEVVDLKPEKISDEQLAKVQEIIRMLNKGQMELGMNEVKRHRMLHDLASLQDKLGEMQAEFAEQYGTFDIDINDGTINHKQDEPSDS